MDTLLRRWAAALAVAATIGVIAWVSNLTTEAQIMGEDRVWWGLRTFFSRVVNSGTVWAGLPVLAGWLVRRPLHAVLAGVVVSEVALVIHYAIGTLTGTMPWASWGDNWPWFVMAVVFCAPLGLVGAIARREDGWGLLARLVVPAGALIEPWLNGMLTFGFANDLADRLANVGAGLVLLIGGIVGATLVLRRHTAGGRRPKGLA